MEFIVCMYPKICVWLDTQEVPYICGEAGYFVHDDECTIPGNDVLIVSRIPPD